MLSLISRNEKWILVSFHSFWNENASRSRMKSEIQFLKIRIKKYNIQKKSWEFQERCDIKESHAQVKDQKDACKGNISICKVNAVSNICLVWNWNCSDLRLAPVSCHVLYRFLCTSLYACVESLLCRSNDMQ